MRRSPWVACLVSLCCLAACEPGPEGLKAVRLGFPNEAGLGTAAIDPAGRAFVSVNGRLWELTGRLEDDSQVWVNLDGYGGFELGWFAAPGYGAHASSPGNEWVSLVNPDARTFPARAENGAAVVRLLLVEPDGTGLASYTSSTSGHWLARLPPGETSWQTIEGTNQPQGNFSSAVRLADGRVFAAHGSRVFELPPGLASASVAFDCNTRELGSCGTGASVAGLMKPLPDGRLVLLVNNPQVEVYAFAPGDAKLTRLGTLGLGGTAINGQVYGGRIGQLAVDKQGTVYVLARTEPSGGEIHLLAHRLGAREDAWVTAVTGLPRVMTLLQDDAGTMWLWDGSDSRQGLFKVVPKTVTCTVCGE